MTHPDSVELLRFASEGIGETNTAIGRHVPSCAACGAEVRRLRAAMDVLRTATPLGAPRSAHLDDETIAALAEGSLGADASAAALPHLAECDSCRIAVASVARALGDAEVAHERRSLGRLRRPALSRFAIPAAAAAVLLLLVARPWESPDDVGSHRSPHVTVGASPTPVSPIGTVSDVETLRWTPVAGADRYRVTVFDASGTVRFESEVVESSLALPDSVGLAPATRYFWKVEARVGADRWTASELVEFAPSSSSRRP